MSPQTGILLVVLMLTNACSSPAQRRAEENREINKKAAQEVSRICALPPDQRDAELKKVQQESGMVLYCGK